MKCSFCGGSDFKEYNGQYICKDCGTKNPKPTGATTMSATTSTTSTSGVCSVCGGKDFKEFDGKHICKNCGTPLAKNASTTTTSVPTPASSTTTSSTSISGVCSVCGGKDFKEYLGKNICKNCGTPLAKNTTSSTTTSSTTTTPKPASTTSKPLNTETTSGGVCAICGGKDFKEYLGKQICKNCGTPLDKNASTSTTATTTTTTTTSTTTKPVSTTPPKPVTENPKPTTKSVSTPKPVETKPVTESVTPTPISYKYDFSIMFKPSVKLFGFESFTKDKKIADDILHYLISKKYKVSEGYGESSDNEIYSRAVIVVGTKADYIDAKMKEKLNCYKRDTEKTGKTMVYYVYDKNIPSGLPIDVSDEVSFNADGDDFLEALSKRFLDESNK